MHWCIVVGAGWCQFEGTENCTTGFSQERRNTLSWNKGAIFLPFSSGSFYGIDDYFSYTLAAFLVLLTHCDLIGLKFSVSSTGSWLLQCGVNATIVQCYQFSASRMTSGNWNFGMYELVTTELSTLLSVNAVLCSFNLDFIVHLEHSVR